MNKLIAMIPARMGSKRLPKKNIRLLQGKPLIQYAIENTLNARCFDEIWVNSESNLIGKLAMEFGVSFHKRPSELASDTTTNQDFILEFLRDHECDYVVMVNPTSPLLQPKTIQYFCEYVKYKEFDTVMSMLKEQAECFFQGKPVNFSTRMKTNSQDLVPVEKIAWALTAWRRVHFLKVADRGECSVFAGRLGLFTIPACEACDIDTQEEWDLAEAMLLFRSKKYSKNIGGQLTPVYWEPLEENR
jgi:CMP-N-acetylneuraminic acid synthetase